ncbi:OmpH family outer membrane protein [Deinococcus hopiensis]|uniref:Periplasmic chaperone for outer membrane proteins Skp n=1 Tax=Deinococcus hopiensis KR-140 TaxID=695939 RepID=A0A1W1VLJ8_9DEIO|nr:OmpH family outer membrane protein [Deinococcus hopiensis]SMB93824.1 periplasmic chaperone for outer membrane proteins Skp [Deinococcus hopiensis KR-140]
MKMNAKALAPVAIMAAFGLGTLAPHAQTAPQKIGFVNVQAVLSAQAAGKELADIQKKADTELGDLDKQIKAIDAKGAQATAADKDKRTQLVTTIQAKAKAYDAQIAALQPKITAAEQAANSAIGSVAKQNGVSIVMDSGVAAQGLVVYAEDSTNMTDAVLKAVK